MNHPLLIRSIEGFRDLKGEFESFLDGNSTTFQTVRQRVAFDEFEDKEMCVSRFFEAVNSRNIRMIERCE